MYYELTEDILFDFGIREPNGMPYDISFLCGVPIDQPLEDPIVFTTKATKGDTIPDFWNTAMPAVSQRFVDLWEGAGVDNLQKFPAIVKSINDGTVWDGYYAVNILGIVKCADLSLSEYDEIFPGNYSFDTLAIDASLAKGLLIFRLHESPSTILIHKSVGKYIGQQDPNRELKGWAAKKVIQ